MFDHVKIGDWVLAPGQPFGLEGTVTAGIISANGRGIGITARLMSSKHGRVIRDLYRRFPTGRRTAGF